MTQLGGSHSKPSYYMRLVQDALKANDMAGAFRIGNEAVSHGIETAQLLTLAAYYKINAGEDPGALDLALRASKLTPNSPDVLAALALCLSRNGRTREALSAYDAALRAAPSNTQIRFAAACALEDAGHLARAKREFARVLESDPNNAEALTRLANLFLQQADAETGRALATRAFAADPSQLGAVLALASADLEEQKFEDALSRLLTITLKTDINAANLAIAQGMAGDALDGLGRIDEAFAAYSASKKTLNTLYRPFHEAAGKETAKARAARLAQYFAAAPAGQWRAAAETPQSPVKAHIFLVGFPRSGTTLLEQILATQETVATMEERDCLIDSAKAFFTSAEDLDRLATLSGEELAPWRDAYWRRVNEAGISPSNRVFIDKMPLNTLLLPLIAKLFPQVKILFALRDPRDVVLSCFRRRFVVTPQMYALTTLDGAAQYYDTVMRLGEISREKLGLEFHDLRYEAVVADFDAEMRKACAFIGIEWKESMRSFAEKTNGREINTPSAAQVKRGLYEQGTGQWLRYAQYLQPVLPVLAPWCERYGYSG